jgi:uncharacterized protein (TIGR02266 family)
MQRRMGDRRESPRIPIKLLVRYPDRGGSFEERDGDIGVGGVYYEEQSAPSGKRVELRFRLPKLEQEVRCEGEIVHVAEAAGGVTGVRVRFGELQTDEELALARFIDDAELERKGPEQA